jgi:chemotaxis protein methyltransferase CheR
LNRLPQDSAYRWLKHQLIDSTGLDFYSSRDQLLSELIEGRVSTLGLDSYDSYKRLLAGGQESRAEMDLLISQLTIGETYFFRDADQFSAIRNVILPDILHRNRASKTLRIWSAGCATGAEPYSLAILLARELAGQIVCWQIAIYASDLNQSYLAKAARGEFREWALRSASDEVKRECFSRKGLTWTIHPRYKEWVSFHHMNLATSDFSAPLADAHFDLILCRNVMIYFTPAMRCRLIGQFHQRLEEGGWLVVGASEYSQENYKAFQTVSAEGARLYRKTGHLAEQMKGVPEPASTVQESSQPCEVPAPGPAPARLPVAAFVKPPAAASLANAEGLLQLADRGDWEKAILCSQDLLARDPLNPSLHFYQALALDNLGLRDQSERSLHQAIYLDRNFALAHYHLGLALKRDQNLVAAKRSFGNVLRVLTDLPADDIVTAGPGVTVTALKCLATMDLQNSSSAEEAKV